MKKCDECQIQAISSLNLDRIVEAIPVIQHGDLQRTA